MTATPDVTVYLPTVFSGLRPQETSRLQLSKGSFQTAAGTVYVNCLICSSLEKTLIKSSLANILWCESTQREFEEERGGRVNYKFDFRRESFSDELEWDTVRGGLHLFHVNGSCSFRTLLESQLGGVSDAIVSDAVFRFLDIWENLKPINVVFGRDFLRSYPHLLFKSIGKTFFTFSETFRSYDHGVFVARKSTLVVYAAGYCEHHITDYDSGWIGGCGVTFGTRSIFNTFSDVELASLDPEELEENVQIHTEIAGVILAMRMIQGMCEGYHCDFQAVKIHVQSDQAIRLCALAELFKSPTVSWRNLDPILVRQIEKHLDLLNIYNELYLTLTDTMHRKYPNFVISVEKSKIPGASWPASKLAHLGSQVRLKNLNGAKEDIKETARFLYPATGRNICRIPGKVYYTFFSVNPNFIQTISAGDASLVYHKIQNCTLERVFLDLWTLHGPSFWSLHTPNQSPENSPKPNASEDWMKSTYVLRQTLSLLDVCSLDITLYEDALAFLRTGTSTPRTEPRKYATINYLLLRTVTQGLEFSVAGRFCEDQAVKWLEETLVPPNTTFYHIFGLNHELLRDARNYTDNNSKLSGNVIRTARGSGLWDLTMNSHSLGSAADRRYNNSNRHHKRYTAEEVSQSRQNALSNLSQSMAAYDTWRAKKWNSTREPWDPDNWPLDEELAAWRNTFEREIRRLKAIEDKTPKPPRRRRLLSSCFDPPPHTWVKKRDSAPKPEAPVEDQGVAEQSGKENGNGKMDEEISETKSDGPPPLVVPARSEKVEVGDPVMQTPLPQRKPKMVQESSEKSSGSETSRERPPITSPDLPKGSPQMQPNPSVAKKEEDRVPSTVGLPTSSPRANPLAENKEEHPVPPSFPESSPQVQLDPPAARKEEGRIPSAASLPKIFPQVNLPTTTKESPIPPSLPVPKISPQVNPPASKEKHPISSGLPESSPRTEANPPVAKKHENAQSHRREKQKPQMSQPASTKREQGIPTAPKAFFQKADSGGGSGSTFIINHTPPLQKSGNVTSESNLEEKSEESRRHDAGSQELESTEAKQKENRPTEQNFSRTESPAVATRTGVFKTEPNSVETRQQKSQQIQLLTRKERVRPGKQQPSDNPSGRFSETTIIKTSAKILDKPSDKRTGGKMNLNRFKELEDLAEPEGPMVEIPQSPVTAKTEKSHEKTPIDGLVAKKLGKGNSPKQKDAKTKPKLEKLPTPSPPRPASPEPYIFKRFTVDDLIKQKKPTGIDHQNKFNGTPKTSKEFRKWVSAEPKTKITMKIAQLMQLCGEFQVELPKKLKGEGKLRDLFHTEALADGKNAVMRRGAAAVV